MSDSTLRTIALRIREARSVSILTGAGVSAASGVPTFRGAGGLWRQYRAEDLATLSAFTANPHVVWEWYAWRRETIARCLPNVAHEVIARWSRRRSRCAVITQNVDDLHLRAGTQHLTRLHGSIWELRCSSGCAAGLRTWRDERVPLPELPPLCPSCGALARPAVVWFGEPLAEADLHAARKAAACDVFVTIGTSSVVYPAAGLVDAARASGALTVEINPDATPATDTVGVSVRLTAEVALPEIDRLITEGE